ncbi:MAG: hypothetical protein WDN75_19860 [Bacteroidota bacterium]
MRPPTPRKLISTLLLKFLKKEISNILKEAPGAFRSFVPILLPIFLIVVKSIVDVDKSSTGQSIVLQIFHL